MQEVLPPSVAAVENYVSELLGQDESGHDMGHIRRVLRLSLKFADAEQANRELVALIALLHDVDDYKLFGKEHAEQLTNAKRIMQACNIDEETQEQVEQAIHEIGYSKRLEGKVPVTTAGKIVSDADMCDGLGASGIIRTHSFGIEHGRPFFDRNILPLQHPDAAAYHDLSRGSSVCHFFEKVLKLKDLMLTDAGRKEAEKRHQLTVDFLRHLFEEEDAEDWLEYLRDYQ